MGAKTPNSQVSDVSFPQSTVIQVVAHPERAAAAAAVGQTSVHLHGAILSCLIRLSMQAFL